MVIRPVDEVVILKEIARETTRGSVSELRSLGPCDGCDEDYGLDKVSAAAAESRICVLPRFRQTDRHL